VAYTRVESAHIQHAEPSLCFELGLLLSDGGELDEWLAELCEERDRLAASSDAYRSAPPDPNSERFSGLLSAAPLSALVLGGHPKESVVWAGAETLAASLEVPLLDLCGERAELRTPAELDLSLEIRLARGLATPPDAGPPPADFHVAERGSTLVVTWTQPIGLIVFEIGLAVVPLIVVGLLIGLGVGEFIFVLAMAPFLFLSLKGLGKLRTAGKQVLEVGDRTLVVKRGSSRETMAREHLELVRVHHDVSPALHLMGDERIVRLPMDAGEAEWLRARIEQKLAQGLPTAGETVEDP
jgi:hypothetical protein